MPGENCRVIEGEEKEEVWSKPHLLLSTCAHNLHCCWTLGTKLTQENVVAICFPSRKTVCDLCYLWDWGSYISFLSRAACNAVVSKTPLQVQAGLQVCNQYQLVVVSSWLFFRMVHSLGCDPVTTAHSFCLCLQISKQLFQVIWRV